MAKSNTQLIVTEEHVAGIFDDICDGLSIVEELVRIDVESTARWHYNDAIKRKWYRWTPHFVGTYEEFRKTHYKEEYIQRCIDQDRAYKRLMSLHNIFGDAIAKNLGIHLSLSDHKFIKVCKNNPTRSYITYNASLV